MILAEMTRRSLLPSAVGPSPYNAGCRNSCPFRPRNVRGTSPQNRGPGPECMSTSPRPRHHSLMMIPRGRACQMGATKFLCSS
jgi:hypothetical protein